MRLFRLFKKDMAQEVEDWVRDGLIESAQGEAILARYNIQLKDAHGTSLGYYVLTALAALFVGLALILIVSHNWDEIPRLTRMLLLFFITLAVNLQGMRLLLAGRDKAGVLWLFFGSLCYGATIMLIAQIYHIGEHFPDGIFYWALGVLPLIFITQSRLIALLCLVLATTWAIVEINTAFFPASYPLFLVAGIWLAWVRKDSALLFMGGLAGLVFWFNLLLAWIGGDWYTFEVIMDQLPATITLGLILTGFSWWLRRRSDHRLRNYGQVLHLWLMRGGLILLLILSFNDAWRELANENYLFGLFAPLLLFFGGAAGFYLARPSGGNASGPLLTNALFFFLAFLWIHLGNVNDDSLAIATNLMLVFTGIWLIRRGIDDAITNFFYTGVGVLLLTALLRYFDLIGDYIGGAVLFLIAATVLFGAARYWRSHMLQKEVADV
jgi:uncharacterized membrane protein